MYVAVRLELHLDEPRVHAERRPLDSEVPAKPQIPGNRLAAQRPDSRRSRTKREPAPGRVGERLHGPALGAATDLLRARGSRLPRREAHPNERDRGETDEPNCEIAPHLTCPLKTRLSDTAMALSGYSSQPIPSRSLSKWCGSGRATSQRTTKLRYGMSVHFRWGGGGGMHTVGYESAQFPGGGGGGAGMLPQLEAVKATTGWSSM